VELAEIKESFEFFDDWEDKYRFILEIGRDLPEMDEGHRIEENLIRGCQSQVWLVHEIEDNKLRFQIDSDAHIVRGLLKILLAAINNLSPSDINEINLESLFEELGLMAHLSMSRGNGLRAMISKINQIAESSAS
tara:strand:+ start:529 stop:933 length:405 start_codon:yes stop_codon:yes gene_type:complete